MYLTRVGHKVRLAGNLGAYTWECLMDFQGQFLGDGEKIYQLDLNLDRKTLNLKLKD
jgi:hypothetical protein